MKQPNKIMCFRKKIKQILKRAPIATTSLTIFQKYDIIGIAKFLLKHIT